MKTIKNVKYLSASEACWYVGVDKNFLLVFSKQGRVNTFGDEDELYYEFEGLNRIKDTLADDVGERMISTAFSVSLDIDEKRRESVSMATLACVVSFLACLICVTMVMVTSNLNEKKPDRVEYPVRTVHSDFPSELKNSLADEFVIDGSRALRPGPELLEPKDRSRTADTK